MEWFGLWVLLSLGVGAYADSKGRSGAGFFALALLLSPLIGFIAAYVALPKQSVRDKKKLQFSDDLKKCPFCAEVIKKEAVKCRFCGSDLPQPALAKTAPTIEADPLLGKCPNCEETIHLASQSCPHCGINFGAQSDWKVQPL